MLDAYDLLAMRWFDLGAVADRFRDGEDWEGAAAVEAARETLRTFLMARTGRSPAGHLSHEFGLLRF